MSYSEMSATITLKKGIKFSDGTPLNADALTWNYQQCMDAKITSVALIKSVVKVDDYTMKLYLTSWDADAGYNITNVCIVSPTAWQSKGAAWGKLNPVGTGPFILASHQTDTLIKYTKNPNYWQPGQPYLDEIDMVVIKDAVTRLNSFKAGEIDVDIDPTFDQAKDLTTNTKYVVQVLHGSGSFRLGPDGGNPTSPLANLAVRQALGYAIDRQTLVDAVFAGFGIPANQWNAPGTWTYNPNITGYTYDPVKAAALLKTAGYDANNPLKTTLIGQNTDWGPLMLQALQNMFAKVNIKADINALALPALSTVWNTGWKNGIGIRSLPPAPFMTSWGCNYVVYSNRSTWVSLYNDTALDELAHQANSAPDMQTRQPLVWQMWDTIFYKDAQQIPILIQDAIVLRYPYTNDDGIYTTPLTGEWHPNSAWLNK
jgi:peptide/nickel transport system substrate-binding protein